MKWKKLHTETLLAHPRLTVAEDEVELPNGHQTKYIYFKDMHDAVMTIVRKGDSILIQQEYSYPPNIVMYQPPGGALEQNETPEEGALRELKEESGYTGTPHYLGYYYIQNRRSNAKMHVVLVDDVKECEKEGGDTEEFIISKWVPFSTLRTMIREGKIINAHLLASLALYDALT